MKTSEVRYFLEIAYNGKNYCGWQKQPDENTVQQEIERFLSKVLQQEINTMGAGRTDAGVHARQMFLHFDVSEAITITNFLYRANSFLPPDISVLNIYKVNDDDHTRFNAIAREYKYYVSINKDPFSIASAYQIKNIPDLKLMNEAASSLLDYTNFQCFSKVNTGVHTFNCKVTKAAWALKDGKLVFTISADRFLRNMVRAIVGTLLEVGSGKITIAEFHDIIKSKNRGAAGTSVPAHGLYLTKIIYPETVSLTPIKTL